MPNGVSNLASIIIGLLCLAVSQEVLAKPVTAHWHVTWQPYTAGESLNSAVRGDIRSAIEMGLDAFALNGFDEAMSDGLMDLFVGEAANIGGTAPRRLKYYLNVDMGLGYPPDGIVRNMLKWGNHPSYLRIGGRPVLTTFIGQDLGDAWWRNNVLSPLADAGMPIEFLPYWNVGNPDRSLAIRYPSPQGFFTWFFQAGVPFYANDPNYGLNNSYSNLTETEAVADSLHAAGRRHMVGVPAYYWATCHSVRQYYEYQGGRGMENIWTSIIRNNTADSVQLITWNDHTESSYFQPTRIPKPGNAGIRSFPHLGYYELAKYYISWFKRGAKPTITKDAVFYFHRTQRHPAQPSADPCSLPINMAHMRGDIEDSIFVTTALTAPAQLRVRTGGAVKRYRLPAGITHTNVPFNTGAQTIMLWRNGIRLRGDQSVDITATPTEHNYNNTSGYAIVGGGTSKSWWPSDKWQQGFTASWFVQG